MTLMLDTNVWHLPDQEHPPSVVERFASQRISLGQACRACNTALSEDDAVRCRPEVWEPFGSVV